MCAYLCKLWRASDGKRVEIANLFLTFLALLTAVVGGYFVYQQVSGVNRTIQSQSETTIDQVTLELDKTLLENSVVIPYLEGHKDLATAPDDDKNKVTTAATMLLDYIDTYRGQEDELGNGPYQTQGYYNYFERMFTQSRILCDVWITQPCEHSRGVEKIARKFCPLVVGLKSMPRECSGF